MCLYLKCHCIFYFYIYWEKKETTRLSELHHSLVDNEVKSNIADTNGKTSL